MLYSGKYLSRFLSFITLNPEFYGRDSRLNRLQGVLVGFRVRNFTDFRLCLKMKHNKKTIILLNEEGH